MTIKLVRMKTGEDVVADIDENEEFLTLENPAVLIPMGEPGEQMQMGFGPWVPFNKSTTVEIPRSHVVFVADPADDLKDNYRQAFGSGIAIPQPQVKTKTLLSG